MCDGEQMGELEKQLREARQRIAALEAEIEAGHRLIDAEGLSRCGDSHATITNGVRKCDDGKPPLTLPERIKWLVAMGTIR